MPEILSNIQSHILITGGSGLIGKYLTSALLAEGFSVSHLSRNQDKFGRVRVYRWDPEKEIADPSIFEGIDYIIHLAGANIGEGRWTEKRKSEIVNSRVNTTRFLYKLITENKFPLKAFISASAVGLYGSETSERIFSENDQPADDFLATTCRLWEEAADAFEKSGIRTVKIRTAMVLEKSDSALTRLLMTAPFGFLVRFGNGYQYIPWIHISDLCGIYLKAIKDKFVAGAYNAAAPEHTTHNEFIKALGIILKKPVLVPNIPSFMLSAVLGEMSGVILNGSRISCQKIINAGYSFSFGNLNVALADLLKNQ
jgi:uncharacterized protein